MEIMLTPSQLRKMQESRLGAWDIMGTIQSIATQILPAVPSVLQTAATYSLQKSQLAAQRLQAAADAQAAIAATRAAEAQAAQIAADQRAQAAAEAQVKLAATRAATAAASTASTAATTAADYMPIVMIGGGILMLTMMRKGKK